MDFLEFFNLNEDPFRLTPDPFYYYPSESHNELLSSLNYVIVQKEGFFLAIGEPGTGKTTVLKVFINTWQDKALIALVMTPRLSPEDFLSTVLEDLKVNAESTNKNDILRTFRNFLVETALKDTRVIIIVDEAQNVPYETLEELRLLSNLETEKEKLLQIVLIGQPQLKKILSSGDLKQLNQRVTVRCTLKPLNITETSDYINYRLIKGGKGNASFEEDACRSIYVFSKGIPRLINLISSRAMMSAYLDGSTVITKKHVMYTIKHLSDDEAQPVVTEKPQSNIKKLARVAFYLFVISVSVIVAVNFFIPDLTWYNPRSAIVKLQPEKDSPDKPKQQTDMQKDVHASEKGAIAETATKEKMERVTATIIVNSANVRAKPGLDAEIIAWVTKDMDFEIINRTKDNTGLKWYEIHLADGREGWISGDIIKLAQ